METRHVIFGAVFVGIFSIGMLNVISDGRLGHAVNSQLPWHAGTSAEPTIDVENLTVEQGNIGEVKATVRNADRVSYTNYNLFEGGKRLDMDAGPRPNPSFVEQSLPPYWNYDHVEKKIVVEMKLNISQETEPGIYKYGVEAWNGEEMEKPVKRNFTVRVEASEN